MAEVFSLACHIITSESTFLSSFLHNGVSEAFILISFFINEHLSTVITIVLEPLANFLIVHGDNNIFQLM